MSFEKEQEDVEPLTDSTHSLLNTDSHKLEEKKELNYSKIPETSLNDYEKFNRFRV